VEYEEDSERSSHRIASQEDLVKTACRSTTVEGLGNQEARDHVQTSDECGPVQESEEVDMSLRCIGIILDVAHST
jgi:hypothetical protein